MAPKFCAGPDSEQRHSLTCLRRACKPQESERSPSVKRKTARVEPRSRRQEPRRKQEPPTCNIRSGKGISEIWPSGDVSISRHHSDRCDRRNVHEKTPIVCLCVAECCKIDRVRRRLLVVGFRTTSTPPAGHRLPSPQQGYRQ